MAPFLKWSWLLEWFQRHPLLRGSQPSHRVRQSPSQLREDWHPHIGGCLMCRVVKVQMPQASIHRVALAVSPLVWMERSILP